MTAITQFTGVHRWLSNFYPSPIVYEGLQFPNVETAYQAAKTPDINRRLAISDMTPGNAKKAGKHLTPPDWRDRSLGVMKELLLLKFADPCLRRQLLATGDAQLIEGNRWFDFFWGVCNGKGANHLGRLLMEVRKEIRAAG